MKLLIISLAEDPHAPAVAAALQSLGHSVVLWDAPAESSAIAASVLIERDRLAWRIGEHVFSNHHFDAIWLRRRRSATLPAGIHSDDRNFAYGEADSFYANLWSIASPRTRWIHSAAIATTGENKLLQLAMARQVGLLTPPSLISNDRKRILQFIAEAERTGQQVIYKTFKAAGWREGDLVKLKHTTPVSRADIEENALIEAVPGIYQQRIGKSFEVRATFFGHREVSVAIDSQRHPYGKEDWRSAINLRGYLSKTMLPAEIYRKCRALMSLMSLDVACFDFIVDEDGTYYFLEFNQQGQFLWVEEECPEVRILDAFVSFVLDERPTAKHAKFALSDVLTWPSYQDLAERFKQERFVHA